MDLNWLDILNIAGSLAFFIYGMKIMSEGIQRVAGSQLRHFLRSMTKNPYVAVLTGFVVTGLIQSSSATTVMTVSFVNAGLLSLLESAGIMIGANIGTTVTGWLISTFGFSLSISAICLPLMVLGVPMLFSKRGSSRHWGEVIIGFAILFVALDLLKATFPSPEENAELLRFLQSYTGEGILNHLLFVAVGAGITMIIQSSSAAMVLTFVMCAQGWLPFHSGAAMVLGENIGTTITAEIAAVVGNVFAKRSARVHTIFNLVGVIWMIFLLPVFLPLIDRTMMFVGLVSPSQDTSAIPVAIAAFHSSFNVLNAILLTILIKPLVNLATYSVSARDEADTVFRLRNISGSSQTPELSIIQAQKEIAKFGDITSRMLGFTKDYLFHNNLDLEKKLYKRIKKYEKITDRVQVELTEYLSKLSQVASSGSTSNVIRAYLSIIDDLENCADIFFQMAKNIQRKKINRIWFTPTQRMKLKELFSLIDEAFLIMNKNLKATKPEDVDLIAAKETEKKINKLRNQLRKQNLRDMDSEEYNIKSSLIYFTLFSYCEKIGDHILNVSDVLKGDN